MPELQNRTTRRSLGTDYDVDKNFSYITQGTRRNVRFWSFRESKGLSLSPYLETAWFYIFNQNSYKKKRLKAFIKGEGVVYELRCLKWSSMFVIQISDVPYQVSTPEEGLDDPKIWEIKS